MNRGIFRRRLLTELLEPRLVLDSTLVINEVMYHPVTNEEGLEWIELYNQLSVDMDISHWRLEGGIDYEFAEGAIVGGGQYKVVAIDPVSLNEESGFADALGPFSGRLANNGEEVRLVNNNDRTMSVLAYNDSGEWPVGPDGSGFSLAKRETYSATDDVDNWGVSLERGGTPGKENFPDTEEVINTEPTLTTLLQPGDDVRILVPTNGNLGLSWTEVSFDDSLWSVGTTSVGFDVGVGDILAYGNLTGAEGSSTFSGSLGHDFVVNSTITITQLGVFDSGADGLTRTLTAELWSRNGNQGSKLAELVFTPTDSGVLVDSNRFKSLEVPLRLSPGDYTIAAHGYGMNEKVGHEGVAGPGSVFKMLDDGGGVISFVDSRLGVTAGSFPSIPEGSSSVNYFSAGTFRFSLSALAGQYATDVQSSMYQVNASAYLRSEFVVTDLSNSVSATLRVTYNDGFVAYLNGVEVARENAPVLPQFDSTATATEAFVEKAFDLTGFLNEFQVGNNVLAIQGLNVSPDDPSFYVLPELEILQSEPQPQDLQVQLAVNELPAASSTEFWAEIVNEEIVNLSLAGYVLANSAFPENVYVFPDQAIPAGGHLLVTQEEMGFAANDQDRIFLYTPGRGGLLDARRVTSRLRGRSLAHDGRWLYPAVATPGEANTFNFHDSIVINEIMYHPFGELPDSSIAVELKDSQTTTALITSGNEASVIVPSDDRLGSTWQLPTFDDSNWSTGPTGVGFRVGTIPTVAYQNLTGSVGSSSFSGTWGHDFVVNSTINVTQLGVFDSGADGLSRTLTAELWSREGNTGTELAQLVFTPGDPGMLVDSNRFKPLADPLELQPGDYTIVAHGYGANEKVGHEGVAGPGSEFKVLNDGNGEISFVDSRFGVSAGVFPSIPEGSSSVNYYSAGTFEFTTIGTETQVATNIESQMHGENASLYLRMKFQAFATSSDQLAQLMLHMKYDDGFVAYLNGTEVARRNAPAVPVWNDSATTVVTGESQQFEIFDISIHGDLLLTGMNVLAIHGLNQDATDDDFLVLPQLELTTAVKSQQDWLELYNHSASTVDLTGWKIKGGINYDFVQDTTIESGDYLVVAKKSQQIASTYPGLAVVGDFSGKLSNKTERIVLEDDFENPVDEVEYFQDGYWPSLADGGGSSLELRDSDADNTKPGAWAASREAHKSTWKSFSYREVAGPRTDGTQYYELVLGLLDAGEVLVDDITVVENPDEWPVQLVQNGTFESDSLGGEPEKWRVIGNHIGTVIEDPNDPNNKVLRILATGQSDDKHNSAGTTLKNGNTFVNIIPGHEYQISFRAKWQGGTNLLNSRLYFNTVAETALLPVPQQAGTPGAENSCVESNIGPTFADFIHAPVVPKAAQPVMVSAIAQDPDGVNTAMLYWRSAADNNNLWTSVPMTVSTDGRLSGTIPGQSDEEKIQFYIEATDGLGVTSAFPHLGPESRALYEVQNGEISNSDRHSFRIIQPSHDVNYQLNLVNVFSNDRLGGTVIFNESEVYYDVGVRLKGAGGRGAASHGYNIRFHTDHLYLGVHRTIAVDRNGMHEMLVKHMNNHAGGIPSMYNDVARIIGPRSDKSGIFMLRLGGFSDVYLDSQFPSGSQGMLFEKDMIYRANTTVDGPEGLKMGNPLHTPQKGNTDIGDTFFGTDDDAYRLQWFVKNNQGRDDFRRIIDMNDAFRLGDDPAVSDDQWYAVLDDVIDQDQWMRTFAMARLAGLGDFYTGPGNPNGGGWNHNFYNFVRPNDNKVIILPWDMDSSFETYFLTLSLLGTERYRMTQVFELPGNLRRLYGHLHDLITTTYNGDYTQYWADHFATKFSSTDFAGPRRFVIDRGDWVMGQLNSLAPQIPFEITTQAGENFSVSESSVTLQGHAWYRVDEIRLEGQGEALQLKWIDRDTWEVTLPLILGPNVLTFESYDYQGDLMATDSITVTTTVGTVMVDSLRITEINYNPAQPTPTELLVNPNLDNDDFEFVELQNIGPQSISLQNVNFVEGIQFVFPSVALLPGERGVVVRNQSAFQLRYGTNGNILGEFDSGGLANGGENLRLTFVATDILNFSYDDRDPWPESADRIGASLELVDVSGTPTVDYGNPDRWRGSTEFNGTPGSVGEGPIGVVINEVLTNTDLSAVDAIELYNTTTAPIDISGWWLSDDADNLFKYEIPPQTIPAGGYVFFDENDFNPHPLNPGLNDFTLDSVLGGQVWLIDPDLTNTAPESIVDHVVFGATRLGETLGRWPDNVGRLHPMTSNTIGGPNSRPRIGPIVISEIMYNPPDPGTGVEPGMLEFVEIYNPTSRSIDLTHWEIDGIGFQFYPDTSIDAGQTLVVVPFDPVSNVTAIASFETVYRVGMNTNGSAYLGPYSGQLSGAGERLTLSRADNRPEETPTTIPLVIEDRVDYNDQTPWPKAADGQGDSLQRLASDRWAGDPDSWASGQPSPGSFGSPALIEVVVSDSSIGEVGQVVSLTHIPQIISLKRVFTNPVVFVQSASYNGIDPVAVRVSDVMSDQFTLYLTEPSNLNALHNMGETVSYVVVEAGTHWLPDGTHLEVGSFTTDATVGRIVDSSRWETVDFVSPFAAPPVLFSQIQTAAGTAYLDTRHMGISSDSFQLALQQEELITTQHGAETIGYLAIDSSSGTWSGMSYEAATTAATFTDDFSTLNFGQSFNMVPSFLSCLASYLGNDNAHLRYQNLDEESVDLKIDEDTTLDEETDHALESVGYLAIGGQGLLTAVTSSQDSGPTQSSSVTINDTGRVRDINVMFDIIHTRNEDLEIFLEAPDGTLVELISAVGGDSDNFTATTLDDEAVQSITSGIGPFSGRFQPQGSLADFHGKGVKGTWQLHVTDNIANSDLGVLLKWSLLVDFAPEPVGNLNHDADVDADDIDLLYANYGSSNPSYDLDSDGNTDLGDVDYLVHNVLGTRYGDVDLDLDMDINDFNAIRANFDLLGENLFSGWRMGNLDGDTDVDISDVLTLVMNFAPLGFNKTLALSSDRSTELTLNPRRTASHTATISNHDLSFDLRPSNQSPYDRRPEHSRKLESHLPTNSTSSLLDQSPTSIGTRRKVTDHVFQEWQNR